jgi:hypothetical protein
MTLKIYLYNLGCKRITQNMKLSWRNYQHRSLEVVNMLRREENRSAKWVIIGIALVVIAGAGQAIVSSISISPREFNNGVFWANGGFHYLNESQVEQTVARINMPAEITMEEKISSTTPMCDVVENGYCQLSLGVYAIKSLSSPAIAFQPGTPDTKKVVGYCTLCNDGTFSPSCAVGRGACSYHSGVQAYDVAEYINILGKPSVPAQPATYSYTAATYRDSTNYTAPTKPALSVIVKANHR